MGANSRRAVSQLASSIDHSRQITLGSTAHSVLCHQTGYRLASFSFPCPARRPYNIANMSFELKRRRFVRSINEKFIFGRIVRLAPVSSYRTLWQTPPLHQSFDRHRSRGSRCTPTAAPKFSRHFISPSVNIVLTLILSATSTHGHSFDRNGTRRPTDGEVQLVLR